MQIEPSQIPPEGMDLEVDEAPTVLALDASTPQAETPISGRVHAQLAGQELIVNGNLSVRVRFRCVRCGRMFTETVREDDFMVVHTIEKKDEYVDLTPDIREAMILTFPNYPLCALDCKGLCAQCGTDLNEGACECRAPLNERWSALDGLDL